MDPIRPKFFQTTIEIERDGTTLGLRGLVSPVGVTKIFLNGELPEFWKRLVGEVINVRIDGVEIPGVLTQQQVEHGSFFEIKFRELPAPILQYLEQRMKSDGVSPGWQRKFPRIPVKGYEDSELPVPNVCVVRFVGQEIYANVMNFTVGGMRIETPGDDLGEIRVGGTLHFDLLTSSGDMLTNLSAEVRNISVDETKGKGGVSSIKRSFGLRIYSLDPVNDRKYRTLIRDYCTILQKRLLRDDEE